MNNKKQRSKVMRDRNRLNYLFGKFTELNFYVFLTEFKKEIEVKTQWSYLFQLDQINRVITMKI